MNRTAAVVWLCCTGERTVDEIVDEVREAFGDAVPREQVRADVHKTVADFGDRGLLT